MQENWGFLQGVIYQPLETIQIVLNNNQKVKSTYRVAGLIYDNLRWFLLSRIQFGVIFQEISNSMVFCSH